MKHRLYRERLPRSAEFRPLGESEDGRWSGKMRRVPRASFAAERSNARLALRSNDQSSHGQVGEMQTCAVETDSLTKRFGGLLAGHRRFERADLG